MSNPDIQRGHYWVFDEQQLEIALSEFVEDEMPIYVNPQQLKEFVRKFMGSRTLSDRGMRRGGTDDT